MLVFFLANGQSVVLTRSPSDKNAEKAFLGYEFSNRKGAEGLKIISGTGQIETALYSETDDADPNKINTLIRKNFLGETPVVPKPLKEYVDVVPLLDLIGFDQVRFDKVIGTNANTKKKTRSGRWSTIRLGDVLTLEYGDSLPQTKRIPGDVPVMGSNGMVGQHNVATVKGPAIIVGRKGSVGKVTWVDCDCFPIDTTFWAKVDSSKVELRFMFYVLNMLQLAELNNGLGPGGFNRNDAYDLRLQLPPIREQNRILRHLARYEQIEAARTRRIDATAQRLLSNLTAISGRRPLKDFCALTSDRVDPGHTAEADFNYVGLEHITEGTGESSWSGPCKGASIKSTKNVFRKGDVLYGKLRPYLNKVWIAEFDGVCTTEMLVLKPRIPATLLKYLLLHPEFVEQAKAKMGGISLPRIKPSDVMQIPVPDVDSRLANLGQLASEIETSNQQQKAKINRLLAAKRAYLNKWLE